MTGRRDHALLVAVAVSAALLVTLALAPAAPWRIPLALFGLWAPGYALLALAYPRGRLSLLERHALSAAAGLCLLPLLALVASETIGLTSARVAAVSFLLTGLLALLAARRERGEAEPVARSALPSTRATLAACALALLLAAAVEARSVLRASEEPASLAMGGLDGGPLDLHLAPDEPWTVALTASAGAFAASGALVVTWDGQPIAEHALDLPAGGSTLVEVALPTGTRGTHELRAAWGDLATDATFVIGDAS